MDSTVKHPVDQTLPLGKAFMLGLQHVLVMYAGAITVPLLIGRELKLEPAQIAFLVSSGLFSCGLVTVLQCLGIFKGFGIKLPIMMGLTFAAVGPLLAFASKNPGIPGLLSILGAVMSAGLLGFFIAPELSRVIKFFPPIVSGCII
ncbi:MAG: solute carrier family 23 protein, partial [Gammaproteobacteria bacterium]|nr:solute carrier family 23 protein [Gammaproteobacteria bacterium]